MVDIENLLSSISDEDMAKLKNMAESIMGNNNDFSQKNMQEEGLQKPPIDLNVMNKLMGVMNQVNKDDYRTRLIRDLKPMLCEQRQKKADDAIRFLQLMEILPLLKGLF